jgi:hypothetical protein
MGISGVSGVGGPSFPPPEPSNPVMDAKKVAMDLQDEVDSFIHNLGNDGKLVQIQDDINKSLETLRNIAETKSHLLSFEQQDMIQDVLFDMGVLQHTSAIQIKPEQLNTALESTKRLISSLSLK